MLNEPVLLWITIVMLVLAVGVIMLVLVYQKKQVEFISERNRLKVAYEKEILESKLEIQEQTMKHISQELHDNIGQVMGLIRLNINSLDFDDPVALREKAAHSSLLLKQAIQDLRDLSKSMHTDLIKEIGLVRSIENEFSLIKRAVNYNTSLVQVGDPYPLEHQHELILFRVFQEALNNIVKHAQATTIAVKIFYEELFVLEIYDDGKGFDFSVLNANGGAGGLGLRNMRNRSGLIGAEFDIRSEAGNGTTVKVQLRC